MRVDGLPATASAGKRKPLRVIASVKRSLFPRSMRLVAMTTNSIPEDVMRKTSSGISRSTRPDIDSNSG